MVHIGAGLLIECNKKSEILWHFEGRLCDKIGLLCDFFRANQHCFTRFQRRKITVMLFNRQVECKRIMKHLFQNKIVKFVQLYSPGKENKLKERKRTLV